MDHHRAWTFRELFARQCSPKASPPPKLTLFHDLSFRVRRGERVGVLGVNGAGKSSLCRCLAGIYQPSRGAILRRGAVRAIFDTGVGILPELTGRENAELLAEFLYPEAADRASIVAEALEFSELGDFIDRPFRVYSNGMQARLCLSLISNQPSDILILDEVFDGADVFFRNKVSARMKKMILNSGAVLFVSHSFDQISQVCNRLLVLHKGKLIYDGSVAEGIRLYQKLPTEK